MATVLRFDTSCAAAVITGTVSSMLGIDWLLDMKINSITLDMQDGVRVNMYPRQSKLIFHDDMKFHAVFECSDILCYCRDSHTNEMLLDYIVDYTKISKCVFNVFALPPAAEYYEYVSNMGAAKYNLSISNLYATHIGSLFERIPFPDLNHNLIVHNILN